jgi:integrase
VTRSESGEYLVLLTSSTYTAKFGDADGRVVERSTGCRDKAAARTVLNRLQAEADEIRAGGTAAKYARYRRLPLDPQIDAFVDQHLVAKGATDGHRYNCRKLLERLKRDCEFENLGDLSRQRFEQWLALQTDENVKLSARSRNAYREVLVSFVNWCVAVGHLPENVFKAIPKANEKSDPRRQRRSLTEDEMVKLLDVARRRPLEDALTVRRGKDKGKLLCKVRPEVREHLTLLGRERSLIYKTMLLTGLRRGELASLTVGQLALDGSHPHVILEAADEKNRQGARIPLRADLAADIKDWGR